MAVSLNLNDFRAFSKITEDSINDTQLQSFVSAAEAQASRICATPYQQLPDSESLIKATQILCLALINQTSFPSKIIMDATMQQARSLLSDVIDIEKQTVFQTSEDLMS